jgi:hypothetical protein
MLDSEISCHEIIFEKGINYPAASGRSMKRKILTLSPSPYPSPQGEGTSGNPTASGWGIKNIINFTILDTI